MTVASASSVWFARVPRRCALRFASSTPSVERLRASVVKTSAPFASAGPVVQGNDVVTLKDGHIMTDERQRPAPAAELVWALTKDGGESGAFPGAAVSSVASWCVSGAPPYVAAVPRGRAKFGFRICASAVPERMRRNSASR